MDLNEIILKVGQIEAKTEEYGDQIKTIFDKVGDMKEALDNNLAHAEHRDAALAEVKILVTNIDHKIENGLRATVNDILKKVETFGACLEKRKVERENKEKRSWKALFQDSWLRFRREGSYLLILCIVISFVWMLWKIVIFGEVPQGLVNLIKIFM